MPTKPKAAKAAEDPKNEDQPQMCGVLRGVLLATIGAASIAMEDMEHLVNRLVERGEIAEKDSKKMVHEMMEKRKGRTKGMEEKINKHFESVLGHMNVSTKEDVDALSQEIADLSKKIDELKTP